MQEAHKIYSDLKLARKITEVAKRLGCFRHTVRNQLTGKTALRDETVLVALQVLKEDRDKKAALAAALKKAIKVHNAATSVVRSNVQAKAQRV